MKGVYMSAFAGFLPAGAPKVLIVVTIDSPKTGLFGGTVAAPAFSRIASFCVSHLRIAPVSPAGTSRTTKAKSAAGGNKKVSPPRSDEDDEVESTRSAQ